MTLVDWLLQGGGTVTLLYGLYLMGNRRIWGPILCGGSEILWIAAFIPHQMYGGIVLSTILMSMQARNTVKWYKEGIR